jgi:transcriptional regulator with XRE-family HTH domain
MDARGYSEVLRGGLTQNRVRERRRALGLGAAVAAATGLDPSTVWRVENGRNRPGAGTRALLAGALRCEIDELFPTAGETGQDGDRP